MKNVCQVCILDLQYGLPVEVRDRVLAEGNEADEGIPKSDTNLQWMVQKQMQLQVAGSNPFEGEIPNQKLLRIARNAPYYRRNLPHKCSFYAKGECNRGDKCPFLHEMPTDRSDPLAHQNVRDRFYGKDDPVAQKLIGRMANMPQLYPPTDMSITTLWIGGLTQNMTEKDIHDAFYSFGEITNIRIIANKGMGFIEFASRANAEHAANSVQHTLSIKNIPLRVNWASKKEIEPLEGETVEEGEKRVDVYTLPPPPGLPPGAQLPELPQLKGYIPPSGVLMPEIPHFLPPQEHFIPPFLPAAPFLPPRGKINYPSMDPNRMGAIPRIGLKEGENGT
jgi:pre-mRNA-splicing factor RBM22/SLT11